MRAAYAPVPGHEYQRGRFIKLVLSLTVSLQGHGAADADLGDSDLSADQCCAGEAPQPVGSVAIVKATGI